MTQRRPPAKPATADPIAGDDTLAALVIASRQGDENAFRQLVAVTYDELRRIGRIQLRRGRSTGLDTTVLVHEAFIKMATGGGVHAGDREHFYAIAARAMRQLVYDELKARATLKRGSGERPLPLQTSIHLVADADEDALRLHDALARLEAVEPRLARLVELRVFAGQSEREAAAALDTSLRTAQRDWRRARAWLAVALGKGS